MSRDRAKIIPLRRPEPDAGRLSDEALIAACSTGDPSALARLFERLCDDVSRFLGRLTYVDAQDVQDLVNDVFLAAFRGAASYQGRSGVKTWIFAIASNIARDRQRKAARGRGALDRLARDAGPAPRSLEREVISKDLVARVERCLPQLPHDLRVAFLMCDVEGLSGVEVAGALGVPRGTLYRRLHDARRLLRRLVEGGEP